MGEACDQLPEGNHHDDGTGDGDDRPAECIHFSQLGIEGSQVFSRVRRYHDSRQNKVQNGAHGKGYHQEPITEGKDTVELELGSGFLQLLVDQGSVQNLRIIEKGFNERSFGSKGDQNHKSDDSRNGCFLHRQPVGVHFNESEGATEPYTDNTQHGYKVHLLPIEEVPNAVAKREGQADDQGIDGPQVLRITQFGQDE